MGNTNINYKQATEEELKQQIEQKQNDAVAYFRLAYLQQKKLKKPQEAEKNYFLAIKNKKNFPASYYNLATLYQNELNSPQKAEKYYLKAISLKQNYPTAYFNLALLYKNSLNDIQKSEQNYLQAIKYKEDYFAAYQNLAILYQENLNDQQKAEQYYILAIKYNKKSYQSYSNLALIYQNTEKNPEKAEQFYQKALQHKKEFHIPYHNLAVIYQDNYKNYEKAENYYIQAIQYQNDYYQSYYNLSQLYKNYLNNPQKSREFYLLYLKYENKLDQPEKAKNYYLNKENIQFLDLLQEQEVNFNKNYKRISELGKGAYGTVFKIQDINSNKEYAMKVVFQKGETEEIFFREINNMLKLQSQNDNYIVSIQNLIKINNIDMGTGLYIVMDLAQCTLTQLYTQLNDSDYLEPKLLYTMINTLLKGLKQIFNNNMYHRDIKPDNILYFGNNIFKFSDFGTSKIQVDDNQSVTVIGTPSYFSPEVYTAYKKGMYTIGKQDEIDINWNQNDIYCLGLTFFASICKIVKMGLYRNPKSIKTNLEQIEQKNIYDPIVFQIIRKMLIVESQKRAQIDELIQISEKLL